MKRPSNSSAIIIAVFLLGAVALISAKINGPTAAPPDEHKEESEVAAVKSTEPAAKVKPGEPTPAAPAMTEEQKQKLKAMKEEAIGRQKHDETQKATMKKMKSMAQSKVPLGNPEAIDVTSDYYTKNQDGQSGISAMEKKIAALKAEQKKLQDEYKRTHPDSKPAPIPMQKTPNAPTQ